MADRATAETARPTERFDDLFRQFYPHLVPLVERLLGERAEAEDIVQEAFLRLARSSQRERPDVETLADNAEHAAASRDDAGLGGAVVAGSGGAGADSRPPLLEQPDEVVGAWLRRVVLNLGVNRLRDRRRADARLARVGRLDPAFDPERGPADDASPSQALLRAEARHEVRAALEALPARQRACLLLRHAGHSYAEIAATLGIAIGSVGVYLARGERAFRAAYRPEDHAAGSDIERGTTA